MKSNKNPASLRRDSHCFIILNSDFFREWGDHPHSPLWKDQKYYPLTVQKVFHHNLLFWVYRFDGFWQVTHLSPTRLLYLANQEYSPDVYSFFHLFSPHYRTMKTFMNKFLFVRFHILKRRTPFLLSNVFIITSSFGL